MGLTLALFLNLSILCYSQLWWYTGVLAKELQLVIVLV